MTRIDVENSKYHETPDLEADGEFTRAELLRCRYILRRLRFLETQIARNGGLKDGGANGGAVHAELEVEALEWVLGPDGVDFLAPIAEPGR